jgi:predicted ATPase/class 3 adenylate cyclase/DNA-binding winged helix-turn-helix (wHTH) protein
MYIRLLGPVEILSEDDRAVALAGGRERVLIATLALGANRPVSTNRLVDALWGEEPPATATNALQVHISKLRKKLASAGAIDVIEAAGGGYVLHSEVDVASFEELVASASGPAAEVAALLARALALWRGPALQDVDSDLLAGERSRLEELRLLALERRLEAELELGRHSELIAELEALVRAEPYREGPRRLLMLALYRSGRQADALSAYKDARDLLADELGIDPGPELQALELAILNQNPDLVAPPPVSVASAASRPPSGIVTLLMSDIEGSTRLWEAYPEQMAIALRRHDDLVRRIIEDHGGYVFKTVGDAFCAAFPIATSAVEAAAAAQRTLDQEPWPTPVVIRVRMGMHTGHCEERDGDYFGPAVNRVARLEAIAHGGQVVVSGTTAEILEDAPERAVSLQDLGVHRLKDLGRPEHVFQLVIPGLEADFPPLRSLDNPDLTNNLPIQVTSFVGRQRELAEVAELVETNRLVTLTGAGGVGKTRLALAVAAEFLDGSGHGVWFVDLAPLCDPEGVPNEVAAALSLRGEPGRDIEETLLATLRERRLLLVLDNCEHLLEPCIYLANTVLRSCPDVHILATSREALGLRGERRYGVPPLSLPGQSEKNLQTSEAVSLFVERVHDQGHELVLDERTMPVVAELCRRLDGMPLAIELACARLRTMALDEIADRLDHRFRLLTGGDRALPRQQTLRALIDWSYDLLSEPERIVLDRLSVFAGDFDLAAAEAVSATEGIDVLEIADIMGSLVDKSLVRTEGETLGLRYQLLETIRQYAAEKLAERDPGAQRSVLLAHACHYLALVEEAAPHLLGHNQADWLETLDAEHDNLRVALDRLLTTQDVDDTVPLRFAIALNEFWYTRHVGEGINSLQAVLDHTNADRNLGMRAELLGGLGRIDEGPDARARIEEAHSIATHLDLKKLRADLLKDMSFFAFLDQDYAEFYRLSQEALQLAESIGSVHLIAWAHTVRGNVPLSGSIEWRTEARKHLMKAIELLGAVGDRRSEAMVVGNLAILEMQEGNFAAARDRWERATTIALELHDERRSVVGLYQLGLAELFLEDPGAARPHLEQALLLADRFGLRNQLPSLILVLGLCRQQEGDEEGAVLLLGASAQLYKDLGIVCQEGLEVVRELALGQLFESLGEKEVDELLERGRGLSAAQTIDIARLPPEQQHREAHCAIGGGPADYGEGRL